MDKQITTLVALGGTVALLNYFGKINEEESLKIILAVVYCTLEKKYQTQTISSKTFISIQDERWISQPFLGSENPSSPANKAFTSAFILKL